jgi:DNA-binding CsgD family transcriptional regulator
LDTLSNLILQIYRAARETSVDEYQDFVLGLVGSLVPFTSSRWATVELADNRAITHCAHLQNEPTDLIIDWDSINRMDRQLHRVTSNPGKAYSIHSETFFADREFAEMRDYTQRYRHANSMTIAELAAKPGYYHGFSLFRAGQDDHFTDSNEQLLEQLFPHMVEALAQNRLLSFRQADTAETASEQGAGAIARHNGLLHYAGSGFNRLLQKEWPDWKGIELPKAVLDAINRSSGASFSGVAITVSASCIGQLIFLRAAPRCPLSRLSPRESSIAQHYSQGLSHKEIADRLDISPVTVRNIIQRIYTKLGINGKAELAVLISRSGHLD